MKSWLTIGQFSKQVSLSQRTIRVYEKAGLIKAHTRGENEYRYYKIEQAEIIDRIKQFKAFGFSLGEIRSLLEIDASMDHEKLCALLQRQLVALQQEHSNIELAQSMLKQVLISLNQNKPGLAPEERRFIMNRFEKTSVLVGGVSNLELTANLIRRHFEKSGKSVPVIVWNGYDDFPATKPYIVVVSEDLLKNPKVSSLTPDVVVIKELSRSSDDLRRAYLQVYSAVGPNMSTILNADDRAVVEFAENEILRKGRTYYFSKNSGLQAQISRIGGVVSDGEKVSIYGLNQKGVPTEINLDRILGYNEEMAYLASLAAIMDFGLKREALV
ncbi:MAG TPA: MerR family transcriptional regulator [Pseudobdellovibrionaceae bacterium]|jgi:DNA-binding transcriptional MerR regulator